MAINVYIVTYSRNILATTEQHHSLSQEDYDEEVDEV